MKRATYVKHKLENILHISRIVSIYYFEFDKNYKFNGEAHDFWEFVYVDKGAIIATAKEKDISLRQGEILFHKPNEFHKLRADGKLAPNIFVMTFDCHSAAMNYFKGRHVLLPPRLRDLIGLIIKETEATFNQPFIDPVLQQPTVKEHPPLGGQQLIRIYLELLLIQLMREDKGNLIFPSKNTLDSHLVKQILQFLEEHLYEELEMDRICAHLNYSKTYLCTVFQLNMHTGIMQYFGKLKIEEAKKLLREGNLNITQISEQLCFCNPHYFSSVFKRYTHMSPREYRQSVKSV